MDEMERVLDKSSTKVAQNRNSRQATSAESMSAPERRPARDFADGNGCSTWAAEDRKPVFSQEPQQL
jgi:hypothetical protein